MDVALFPLIEASGNLLPVEIAERKGLGHPDTICDHLTEELSLELSRRYMELCGRVLHYNVDKALLWGGCSEPAFGGGHLTRPMEIFLAGRATIAFGDVRLPLDDVVREVAENWLSAHLPLFDPARHLRTHCLVRPGSTDLGALFDRGASGAVALANDTSIGVGYAPLSRLEAIALATEHELGRLSCEGHPQIGRDVKVMAMRQGEETRLTVACAFVGRHLASLDDYLDAKIFVANAVRNIAVEHGANASVEVNLADDPASQSIYLTVLGTSAECGDDGQAGRGNRVNGLITPFRPMTMESVPGKNAVSHVGKLYNIAASLIADRAARLADIAEAQCLLVSGIGRPINDPQLATIRLRLASGGDVQDYEHAISGIVVEELDGLGQMSRALMYGELRIGDWPLRSAEFLHSEGLGIEI